MARRLTNKPGTGLTWASRAADYYEEEIPSYGPRPLARQVMRLYTRRLRARGWDPSTELRRAWADVMGGRVRVRPGRAAEVPSYGPRPKMRRVMHRAWQLLRSGRARNMSEAMRIAHRELD